MAVAHLLAEWQHEAALTRKMLAAVPADKLDWKPHSKSNSLGGLATHITQIPWWGVITFDQDHFDFRPEDVAKPVTSSDELLARFDDFSAQFTSRLEDTEDVDLAKPWTFKAGGREVFTLPRGGVLRSFILSHLIHHRGQLSVYLRMLDVPVPGMYGPSADESAPR